MATLKIFDEADQFRIEIAGQFSGSCVNEVQTHWQSALAKASPRRVTVDISRLAGYESSGRKLLRNMHHHGAIIAAATPRSLIFLAEITAPVRRGPLPEPVRLREDSGPAKRNTRIAAAGGE